MAAVYGSTDSIVAHEAGVHAAVKAARDVIQAKAQAKFAAHDNPGGHHITTDDGDTDAFVSLEGPAPLSVEFGHWTAQSVGNPHAPTFVRGLHILTGSL